MLSILNKEGIHLDDDEPKENLEIDSNKKLIKFCRYCIGVVGEYFQDFDIRNLYFFNQRSLRVLN